MTRLFLSIHLLSLALISTACGSKADNMDEKLAPATDNDLAQIPGTFPEEYLKDFSSWRPVLDGDKAFVSQGHGGIVVRGYLNPVALSHIQQQPNPYPLPEGAVLAKAVVASLESPVTAASRVYFMKKEAQGFDSANNNWSYAVANLRNGQLIYDSSVSPKEELCVSCHAKFAAYDYVQTVDFFKRQSTGM